MNARSAIVHVVDDDDSFRTAIQRLLRAAGYETRTYASAGEFLVAPPGTGPGCVVLDVQMPGLSGLDLQDALLKGEERLPIVFISGHANVPASVRAMKAGAVDFLLKPIKRELLLGAIQNALTQDAETRAARELQRKARRLYERLTPREREVFEGVVEGKLNKEIAAELGTVERTIKAHRSSVMEKMQARSMADLVHMVHRLRSRP